MTTPKQNGARNKQSGAALIVLMLVIVLSLVTLLTFRSERRGPELEAQRKTALALAQAKEALLGRAASHRTSGSPPEPRPGILPCPDSGIDGIAEDMCNSNALGRLPWRTLGLPDLGDGAYGRLWYKLSKNFQGTGSKVNTTTAGTLTIGGAGPMFAAIVFAPGAPLDGQVRDTAHYNDFLAYLEGYTNVTDTDFNNASAQPINDRYITILPSEIKNVIVPIVAEDVRISLNSYPPPLLSYPASYSALTPSPWLTTNGWINGPIALITYQKTGATVQVGFSPGGCQTVYQYRWDADLDQTVMVRNGKC